MNKIKILVYVSVFSLGVVLIYFGSQNSSQYLVTAQQSAESKMHQVPVVSGQKTGDVWSEIASKLGLSFVSASIIAIILEFFLENPFDQVRERIDKATERVEREVLLLSTGIKAGVNSIYARRSDIPPGIFKEKLEANPESVDVLAAAGGKYTSDLINLLFNQKMKGRSVRILFPDPNSEVIKRMQAVEGVTNIHNQINATVSTMLRAAKDRAFNKDDLIEMVRFYDHTIQCSFTRIDGYIIVSHYLAKWWGDGAPTLIVRRGADGLFESYMKHFDVLWQDYSKSFSEYMVKNNIDY